MEKSISEQMDDMRQKTKDAYVRGIGTPESEVEQRADNSRSHAICPKCKSGRVFETAHWTWICCDCHFGW